MIIFQKPPIEREYSILVNPITLANPTINVILEQIRAVLGNLFLIYNIIDNYIEKDNMWLRILAAAAFTFISTKNRVKCYSTYQLVFGHDMILLIKKSDWESILQKNKVKINNDKIRMNIKIVDHGYKIGDKSMTNSNVAIEYETPYTWPFDITHCCTNGTVTLQYFGIKIRYNICRIKLYTSNDHV